MTGESRQPVFVVMAKEPVAGRVNTRTIDGHRLDASSAANLAWAMLRCVVGRLAERGRVIVATSPDDAGPGMARQIGDSGLATVGQGDGELGQRIEHVWRQVAPEVPAAFFGIDSPDVPSAFLDEVCGAMHIHDVVLGPTIDGGYWTVAGRACCAPALRQIDWGSGWVYHQSCRRARAAGLTLQALPFWHDVDRPADVLALRQRLSRCRREGVAHRRDDRHLQRLAVDLERMLARGPGPAEGNGT